MALALACFASRVPVYAPVLPEAEIAEDFDERDHNLAVQLLHEGATEAEARAIAERLVREHPASARMKILLAETDFRGGGDRGDLLASVEPLADEPSLKPRERFHAQSLAAWVGSSAETSSKPRDDSVRLSRSTATAGSSAKALARAIVGGADVEPAAEARSKTEEALGILDELPATAAADGDPWRRELLRAQAEFLRGRAILAGSPADDSERKLGQDAVQSALDRLKPIAEAPNADAETRRRVRLLGGGIQLYRGNWKPAENHFRAALEIYPIRSPNAGCWKLSSVFWRRDRGPKNAFGTWKRLEGFSRRSGGSSRRRLVSISCPPDSPTSSDPGIGDQNPSVN